MTAAQPSMFAPDDPSNAPDVASYLTREHRREAEKQRVALGAFVIGLALGAVLSAAVLALIP